MTRSLPDSLRFARRAAEAAAAPIVQRFLQTAVTRKPDGSEVTEAYREAERVLRRLIREFYPSAAILGEEEGGPARAVDGDLWIVDPIDGTRSFITGSPLFGTLIGLVRDGQPVLGVAHLPLLGESLYAAVGHGCWWQRGDAAPIACHVRDTPLADAYICLTHPDGTDLRPLGHPEPLRLNALLDATAGARWGGDLYAHVLVARGGLQLAVDAVMQPWDIAALVPCIREAGGVATTLSGDDDVVFGGSLVTATSRLLLDTALDLLRGSAR